MYNCLVLKNVGMISNWSGVMHGPLSPDLKVGNPRLQPTQNMVCAIVFNGLRWKLKTWCKNYRKITYVQTVVCAWTRRRPGQEFGATAARCGVFGRSVRDVGRCALSLPRLQTVCFDVELPYTVRSARGVPRTRSSRERSRLAAVPEKVAARSGRTPVPGVPRPSTHRPKTEAKDLVS